MATFIYAHPVFEQHETPPGHAEQQARYTSVEAALKKMEADVHWHEAPLVERAAIDRAHQSAYVDEVENSSPATDIVQLDPDTFMGPHSLEAARRGAGGVIAAVDALARGDAFNAFVASRPPGHHTEPDKAMGFCLFNNAAIAALHGRAAHGWNKVAVVDFDVHHGNGTQAILERDEQAFFASSHEWPQYPGTGKEDERGIVENCFNATIPSGEGSDSFRRAWGERLLPALSDFDPDLIVISAGFDAHTADPLGGLNLTDDDYVWITKQLKQIASDSCENRIVSVLEGGYDLHALGESAAAHVKTLASAI